MLTLLLLSGLFLNLFVLLLEHGTRVYLVGPWKLLMSTWLHHTLPTCAPPPTFLLKTGREKTWGHHSAPVLWWAVWDLVMSAFHTACPGPPSGNSDDKESTCNEGDLGSIPGLGRSPEEENGNPLQYSCLENPMDRGTWWATVHGLAKSQTRLSN